ncbi:hypothetical protein PISMIDRAFT_445516 [Pisolithus microcarpus 441]|uniref:Unplaced genomic scaffold scaffold_4, whole genome shotgun sequence n=1 Tax=Pisolithus microcarpus 441 TaxID=765257 RepID=A0A0C9ZV49_9AGAM|nr:hypothetical protein PISMIDRAFT_445516 [Pisolithus microcarpus 441]
MIIRVLTTPSCCSNFANDSWSHDNRPTSDRDSEPKGREYVTLSFKSIMPPPAATERSQLKGFGLVFSMEGVLTLIRTCAHGLCKVTSRVGRVYQWWGRYASAASPHSCPRPQIPKLSSTPTSRAYDRLSSLSSQILLFLPLCLLSWLSFLHSPPRSLDVASYSDSMYLLSASS